PPAGSSSEASSGAASFGQTLNDLGKLMNRSPIVRDVLEGRLSSQHGEAALKSAEQLERTAQQMRRQITGEPAAPNATDDTNVEGVAGSRSVDGSEVNAGSTTQPKKPALLVELPPVPAGSGRAAKVRAEEAGLDPHL